MKDDLKQLRRKQLDSYFKRVRQAMESPKVPRGGWISEIRKSLGMTTAQLAKRLHVSQPTVHGLEKSEGEGKITLHSLEKAAQAMNCDVTYVLLPRADLTELVRRQAEKHARNQLRMLAHSMSLEDQDISETHLRDQLEQLTNQTIAKPPRTLWD